MSPAVSLRPRASSSSRQASRPPSDVTLEPWNSSFRRGSNVTRRAAVSSSPAAPSISSPLQPRGRGRAGKTFEVVAPLQKRHYAPGTPPVSDFHQLLRRPGKVRLGELKISQRIAPVGVKSGRDEDEVRPERLNARQDGNVERLTEDVTTIARPQRRVHDRIVLAPFGSRPSARIERHLVSRAKEHARVAPEDLLRAVAVVHIPVDNGDALRAVRLLSVPGCNRSVVEEAKAHGFGPLRMVAGRAHRREGVADLTGHYLVDGLGCGASGSQRRIQRP